MPLIAWCALAYAAGLLGGFALAEREALLFAATLAAVAIAALRLGRGWIGGAVAIATGGLLVAVADGAHERECGRALTALRRWELPIEQPASDGDVARGSISALGCTRRVSVFVESGHGSP